METLFTHGGNLDSLDETYDLDYVGHAPPSPDIIGPEAAKGFPGLQTTTEDLLADEDSVVVRWTTSGTHQGGMEAVGPSTGNRMEITGITIQRVAEGKIVEGWTNADTLGQMQQLGMGQRPQ
jgi:hypothetical protein